MKRYQRRRRLMFGGVLLFVLAAAIFFRGGTFLFNKISRDVERTPSPTPEVILRIRQLSTPINFQGDDAVLIQTLRTHAKEENVYVLDTRGEVGIDEDQSATLPEVEVRGLVSPGDFYLLLGKISWGKTIEMLTDIVPHVSRLIIAEEDLIVFVDSGDPFLLFLPMSALDPALETAKKTLTLLRQEKKVIMRLDLRFGQPLIHLKEVI